MQLQSSGEFSAENINLPLINRLIVTKYYFLTVMPFISDKILYRHMGSVLHLAASRTNTWVCVCVLKGERLGIDICGCAHSLEQSILGCGRVAHN
jgi:hypothetical protein